MSKASQQPFELCRGFTENLGHPSTASLVELLSSRGASPDVQVAGSYVCSACQRYKKPNQTAPSTLAKSDHFKQRLQADVFWIQRW